MTTVTLQNLPALAGLVGQIRRGTSFDVTSYNDAIFTSSVPEMDVFTFAGASVVLADSIQSLNFYENQFENTRLRLSDEWDVGRALALTEATVATTSSIYSDHETSL